jgi:triacylglycerol lipase
LYVHFHKKLGAWLADYGYMFHGALATVIYREPPKHYLGYTVAGKVPVILVPGILGTWSFMKKLGDRISLKGHPVYIVPELGHNIYSIPSSAKTLRSIIVHTIPKRGHIPPRVVRGARAVRTLIEKENIKGAVLVAHSKGGLIGKYLLAHHNTDNRVLGMVAIATPFSGSAMAKLIPHDSFKELQADSEVIRDLERHKAANEKIISIIPEYDNHVWADKGSFLEGASENIEVSVSGHHKVLFSKAVLKVVLNSIEKITQMRHLELHK